MNILLTALYRECKNEIRQKEIWTFTIVLVIISTLLINLAISSLVFDNSDGSVIGVVMNIEGMVTALFFAISEILVYCKLSDVMKKSLYFYYIEMIIPYSTLSSFPLFSLLWIWKNLGLKKILKNLFKQIMPLNLLWARSSYFFVFFLFKIRCLNSKTTLKLHFLYKSCKMLENFGEFWKIKITVA